MASFYTVVQYMPEVIRGESINIGVMAFQEDSEEVHVRFLKNWDRVKQFLTTPAQFSVIENWLEYQKTHPITASEIKKQISKQGPYHSVWFRDLAASLLGVEALIEDVAGFFLFDLPKKDI
jgi:hypothetical protein